MRAHRVQQRRARVAQREREHEPDDADRTPRQEPLQLLATLARRSPVVDQQPQHRRQAEGDVRGREWPDDPTARRASDRPELSRRVDPDVSGSDPGRVLPGDARDEDPRRRRGRRGAPSASAWRGGRRGRASAVGAATRSARSMSPPGRPRPAGTAARRSAGGRRAPRTARRWTRRGRPARAPSRIHPIGSPGWRRATIHPRSANGTTISPPDEPPRALSAAPPQASAAR